MLLLGFAFSPSSLMAISGDCQGAGGAVLSPSSPGICCSHALSKVLMDALGKSGGTAGPDVPSAWWCSRVTDATQRVWVLRALPPWEERSCLDSLF